MKGPFLYRFKNETHSLDGIKIDLFSQSRTVPKDDSNIYCASCGLIITSKQEMIQINGSFEHLFTNPNGIEFHFGTYKNAPGCIQT